MKVRYLIAVIAALSASATAFATDDGEALFTKSKCISCHKPDAKAVGPSLKAIAAKYAGNKDAQAMLEKKVRAGGGGVWGTIPMPRMSATVSDADIKTLVAWVLSQK